MMNTEDYDASQLVMKDTMNFYNPKPNYTICFAGPDNVQVGCLDFSSYNMSFTGNADKSALHFIDYVAEHFQNKIDDLVHERYDYIYGPPEEMIRNYHEAQARKNNERRQFRTS